MLGFISGSLDTRLGCYSYDGDCIHFCQHSTSAEHILKLIYVHFLLKQIYHDHHSTGCLWPHTTFTFENFVYTQSPLLGSEYRIF